MKLLNIPGIPNGYWMDEHTGRGGQPLDAAFPLLARAGFAGVIDLNNTGAELQRQAKLANLAGLLFFGDDWNGITIPSQQQVGMALAEMDAINLRGPVFVHCQHGSDRTGTLCACRRIERDGYTLDRAIQEAFCDLGFQGLHECWMAAAAAEYFREIKGAAA